MCKRALLLAPLLVWGGRLQAQPGWEWQVHGLFTFVAASNMNPDNAARFLGGGAGLGWRNRGRLRALVTASLGDQRGSVAVRPEALVSFSLNPFKRRGVTPYGGGGLAAVFSREADREYLLLVIGVEANPGASFSWFVEGGVGGGVRLSAGFRRRMRGG